jgi:hypothetical protein
MFISLLRTSPSAAAKFVDAIGLSFFVNAAYFGLASSDSGASKNTSRGRYFWTSVSCVLPVPMTVMGRLKRSFPS